MLILFQILFLLFVAFALYSVGRKKSSGVLGRWGLIFWVSFWLGASVLILWPQSTVILANYLGIGRGADLVFYSSLLIIFFVLFRLHVKIETMSRDITKIVRKEALEEERK